MKLTDQATRYFAGSRIFEFSLKTYARHQWGHEPGHTMGLPDYYEPAFFNNGYGLSPRSISITQTQGGYRRYSVGEIMDGGMPLQYVSNKSIILSLTPAVEVANKSTQNTVRIHLGGSYDTAESMKTGTLLRMPTYDLDSKQKKKKK